MTGNSPSTGHPVPVPPPCASCHAPQPFHLVSCRSHVVFSLEKAVEHLIESSQVLLHEIQPRLLPADGSSLTRRGAGASRSWSVTGSSGSVCRRLRLAKSGSTSGRGTSAGGTATGRTLGSSRSLNAGADIIGMAARIPAEKHVGPIHDAFCPICKRWEK